MPKHLFTSSTLLFFCIIGLTVFLNNQADSDTSVPIAPAMLLLISQGLLVLLLAIAFNRFLFQKLGASVAFTLGIIAQLALLFAVLVGQAPDNVSPSVATTIGTNTLSTALSLIGITAGIIALFSATFQQKNVHSKR